MRIHLQSPCNSWIISTSVEIENIQTVVIQPLFPLVKVLIHLDSPILIPQSRQFQTPGVIVCLLHDQGRGAFDPEVIEPDIFISLIYKERLRMTGLLNIQLFPQLFMLVFGSFGEEDFPFLIEVAIRVVERIAHVGLWFGLGLEVGGENLREVIKQQGAYPACQGHTAIVGWDWKAGATWQQGTRPCPLGLPLVLRMHRKIEAVAIIYFETRTRPKFPATGSVQPSHFAAAPF
ncbi:hypothetical protein C943_02301 [Mariniradius saccharolyticus AK6]|uniref:Uncharacterized protein n=1 Tax=Mariniradius saccharolyticus AK6 TaxID=1239962 RepID=M7YDI6_9BACT|nr:hypothetical protein C943_02301 [Mariniradius saccharolyticus AK6]